MVSCCIYTYMIISMILIAFVIGSFIITADLVETTNYTICSVQ